MAKGTVNKVILIGRLGSDPELRYTPAGQAVANFNVATNESWKSKDGNAQDRTDWHKIILWRNLAELANEYLKKGSRVYLEGKLQTRSWDDKGGNKRYVTEVVADQMQFLDGREGMNGNAGSPSNTGASDRQAPAGNDGSYADEDDLPF